MCREILHAERPPLAVPDKSQAVRFRKYADACGWKSRHPAPAKITKCSNNCIGECSALIPMWNPIQATRSHRAQFAP